MSSQTWLAKIHVLKTAIVLKKFHVEMTHVEPHLEAVQAEARVEGEQHQVDREPGNRDADNPEPQEQQSVRAERCRQRGEHLAGILEAELLVREDVGLEHRIEARHGDAARHDGQNPPRQPRLVGSETRREESACARSKGETEQEGAMLATEHSTR